MPTLIMVLYGKELKRMMCYCVYLMIIKEYFDYFHLFCHRDLCGGYSLEPPHQGNSNEYPQQRF